MHDKSWCRAQKNLALAIGPDQRLKSRLGLSKANAGLKLSIWQETARARAKANALRLEFPRDFDLAWITSKRSFPPGYLHLQYGDKRNHGFFCLISWVSNGYTDVLEHCL